MNEVLVTYSNSEYYFAGGIFDWELKKFKKLVLKFNINLEQENSKYIIWYVM